MKRIVHSLTLMVTSALLGCSSTTIQPDKPAPITHQPATIQGRIVIGAETSSLTPCATQAQYLLVLSREQQQQFAAQIRHPYQELYVELSGELQVPSQTGFNADYRARILVQQINQIGQDAIQGCATATSSDPQRHWAASYQAQSQQANGLQIELTLQANHLATTEYRYPDNRTPIIEQGFWQQLNPQQIEVVITHYQQQYLVTRRIFTLSGNTLHTDQEQIGQKLYPIRDGGITLFRVEP